MKIAIHNSKNGLNPKWLEYCIKEKIPYKLVDCYSNNITEELKDCDALLWHFHQQNYKDVLFAKQLLYSLEQVGKITFPNFHSNWHFDDKLGQKYLFELFGFNLIPTHVFYTKKAALDWAKETTFPKVWKLRGGAGASNVKLIKTKEDAFKIIKKGFKKGFKQYNGIGSFLERLRKYRNKQTDIKDLIKGFTRIFIPPFYSKVIGRDVGYIYFQDFVPQLEFDYRTKVIDGKCWGYKRPVRKNDFRASGSGSGNYKYGVKQVPIEIIKLSQNIAKKLKMDSVAFDFVVDSNKNILLIESSCFFGDDPLEYIGYWDENSKWIDGFFKPEEWILNLIIERIKAHD